MSFFATINKYKSMAMNAGYYLVASIIGAVIQLVMNPFLSLRMDHADFAIVGYYASFGSLISPFIGFSLAAYYARQYYLCSGEERVTLKESVVTLSVLLSGGLSIISYILFYSYLTLTNVQFPIFPYALLSIVSVFFTAIYTVFIIDLRMARDAKKYLFVHVSHGLLTAIGAILMVVVFKWGGLGRMLASAVTSLFFFVYCLAVMGFKLRISREHLQNAVKFCWPLAAAAMLGYVFNGIDRAMLEPLHDVKNLGLYNIAVQITTYLSLFPIALSQTFQPDVYQSIARKQYHRTIKIVALVTALGLVPVVIFIILAKPVISVLTFGRYGEAASFATILALKNVTMSFYYSICGILEGTGLTKSVLMTRVIGSVGVIMLYRTLVTEAGFYGAAWGQVLSFCLMAIITMLYIFIYKGHRIRSIFITNV